MVNLSASFRRALGAVVAGLLLFLCGCGSNSSTMSPAPTPTPTPIPTPTPTAAMFYEADSNMFGTTGIDTFSIDPQTNRLIPMNGSQFSPEFSGFAVGLLSDKSKQFFFTAASSQTGINTVALSFKRNSDGSLTEVASMTIPNSSPTAIAIDPQNRFFYVAAINLLVFRFDATSGALSLASSTQLQPATAGLGGLSPDMSGNFLYVSLQGNGVSGVAELSVHADGSVTQNGTAALSGAPFPGPVFANAANVYVGNQTGGVFAFSIASGSGALTPVNGSPFKTNSETITAFLQSGNFLYVGSQSQQTSNGQNPATIFAFQIQNGGGLLSITGSPFQPAFNAQSFCVNNSFLYAGDSTGVETFRIDTATGDLTFQFVLQDPVRLHAGCLTVP